MASSERSLKAAPLFRFWNWRGVSVISHCISPFARFGFVFFAAAVRAGPLQIAPSRRRLGLWTLVTMRKRRVSRTVPARLRQKRHDLFLRGLRNAAVRLL